MMKMAPPTISRRRAAHLGALLTLGLWAGGVLANSCGVSSTAMAFGTYQPQAITGQTSTATVSVTCIGNATSINGVITLSLGASSHGSGDHITTRYMQRVGGSDLMAFNIYTNASYATVWGNGTTGAVINGSIANKSSTAVTVYGKIPAGQYNMRAGSYSDAISITLTYTP